MAFGRLQILYISLMSPFGSGTLPNRRCQASLCISLYNKNTRKYIEQGLPVDLNYYKITLIMSLGLGLIISAPLLKVSPIAIHQCDVGRRSVCTIDSPCLITDHNRNAHTITIDTSADVTHRSNHRRSLIGSVSH